MSIGPEKVDSVARDLVSKLNTGNIEPDELDQITQLTSGVHDVTVDEVFRRLGEWDITEYEEAKDNHFAGEKFSEREFSKVITSAYIASGLR